VTILGFLGFLLSKVKIVTFSIQNL